MSAHLRRLHLPLRSPQAAAPAARPPDRAAAQGTAARAATSARAAAAALAALAAVYAAAARRTALAALTSLTAPTVATAAAAASLPARRATSGPDGEWLRRGASMASNNP